MTLEIVVEERLDDLIAHLAKALDGHRDDPFSTEMVVVPSAGTRRWVEQRLANELGVVANVELVLPGQFSSRLKAAASDTNSDQRTIGALTGHIFDLGNPLRPEPEISLDLATSLHGDGSWMARSRYIADLFDRYGMHRPDMLTAWSVGNDIDGAGKPLQSNTQGRSALWQPALWRLICGRAGISPAEQLELWTNGIRSGKSLSGIPANVHVFGLSSMSVEFVRILDALASNRQVALFIAAASAPVARQMFAASHAPPLHHPLLATWNRAQTEGLQLIATRLTEAAHWAAITGVAPHTPTTLLAQVQSDLRANTAPGSALTAADESVQFHACSGHPRQVEVLRDAVLHELADDPELSEADIVVLCPKLDRYAPLIEAIWGHPADHDDSTETDRLPALRYSINQTSLAEASPLLDAIVSLFELVAGRITHSELASFLTLEPVRLKFELGDDYDLHTAIGWLERTAMRWGIDGDHRSAHSALPESFQAHTLDATIDSLTASMALPEATISPSGPAAIRLDLSQFALAGRVAEFAQGIANAHSSFVTAGPAPLHVWQQRITDACADMFAIPTDEAWQQTKLDSILTDLEDLAPNAAPLTLDDIGDAFQDQIDTRPGWRRFGTGAIIIDEPQALRSIPHKVVCILGFDEDAIPRPVTTHDDLIAAAPQLGDRDRRLDAKQQLLDAVLSATQRLIITFSDHNVHTNAQIPPSVALQELIETVTATVTPDSVGRVVRAHSRYAHTSSNFDGSQPWSFDEVALAASTARSTRRPTATIDLPEPIQHPPLQTVTVGEILTAATYPTDIYVQQTLGVRFPPDRRLPSDFLPVNQDGLERWMLGSDLLHRSLRGLGLEDWTAEKRAAGQLPPGVLAERASIELKGETDKITQMITLELGATGPELAALLEPERVQLDYEVHLDGAPVRVFGPIACSGDRVVDIRYSRRKGAAEVELWARTLMLTTTDRFEQSVLFSKGGESFRCAIDPARPDEIDAALAFLARRYDQARSRVVAVFGETSKHLGVDPDADSTTRGKALGKAREAWWTNTIVIGQMGDRTRQSVAAFFAGQTFDDLIEAPIGARAAAQELWGHIRATTQVWG